jgi:hypothetical protein
MRFTFYPETTEPEDLSRRLFVATKGPTLHKTRCYGNSADAHEKPAEKSVNTRSKPRQRDVKSGLLNRMCKRIRRLLLSIGVGLGDGLGEAPLRLDCAPAEVLDLLDELGRSAHARGRAVPQLFEVLPVSSQRFGDCVQLSHSLHAAETQISSQGRFCVLDNCCPACRVQRALAP